VYFLFCDGKLAINHSACLPDEYFAQNIWNTHEFRRRVIYQRTGQRGSGERVGRARRLARLVHKSNCVNRTTGGGRGKEARIRARRRRSGLRSAECRRKFATRARARDDRRAFFAARIERSRAHARCQASLESREVGGTLRNLYTRGARSPSISSGSMNRMINVHIGIPPTFLLRAARKTYEPRPRTIN